MAKTKRVFRTKKVLSGVKTEYRGWNDWEEGDVLIGTLQGTSKNRKKKDKVDWILKVEEVSFQDRKDQRRLEGAVVTLNSCGSLDKGMEQVENGETVQITYNGKIEMEGGDYAGEMAHTMEVVLVSEEGEEDADESDDDDEEQEDDDDEEFEDEEDDVDL